MRETRIIACNQDTEREVTLIGSAEDLAVCIKALVEIGYNKFKMVPNVDE